MSYCVFIIRQFKEGSCLIVFLLFDSLRRAHVLLLSNNENTLRHEPSLNCQIIKTQKDISPP
jgi:hypothetical protein